MTTTKTITTQATTTPTPRLIDLSVSCCSSESEYNKSSNVLLDDTYRIWQTKDKTGKAFIELQFPTPSLIHQIDITNAGSAFIEVLVGLVTWEPTEFLVLVPLTNFMSLSETTNKTNRNRSKSFNTSKFSLQTVPRKWERVRIVCSQPWLDDNLGISLVKIYAPPSNKKDSTTKLSLSSNNITPQLKTEKLGDNGIELTDTSSSNIMDTNIESDPNTQLKSDKTQALSFVSELKRSNSSTPKKLSKSATVLLSNPLPGQVLVINQKSKSKGIKEPEKEIETEEEDEIEKNEIKKKLDQQQQQQKQASQKSSQQPQKQKSKLTEPKQSDEDDSMQDIKIINNGNKNENKNKSPERKPLEKLTNTNDGETDEECVDFQVIATPKQQQKLTPFGNLLKGVVLVIGGITNPQRGEIREKALEMGAGYKPDWCREATHLVTPFKGTDKFKVAQKSGGSIVKPKWIEDCYKSKSRLPIKKYTFQDYESGSDEDDTAKIAAATKKAKKTISTDSTSKKRKKKGAPGSDDSDDDSHIPNVYDYNDGFIDNSFSSSEASEEKDPDHLDEHVHENVGDLLNDGLDYLKRTYGYKPDRDLIQHNPYHKKQKNHHTSENNGYKSSHSYKPNKYYNESFSDNNNNNNNDDDDDNNRLQTSNKKDKKEEKNSYKPKQQNLEEFDDDSLFDNHDTVLMTPEQIKDEIDRLVNNYNNSDDDINSNNKIKNKPTTNGSISPNISNSSANGTKKISSPPSQQQQSPSKKNEVEDSIIPQKCSTQLPKNNAHDFKGKEYILNPLPSFFEGFEFYLSIKDEALRKNIIRLITAYKGSISAVPTNSTNFIITDKTVWDRLFDITKQKYPNVLFLGPSFVMQSHNYQKFSSVDKHLILKSK
ncbi:hypothetical protein RB653_002461 [Dictyostelium firmibasis]|uniref:BRCT domain-containing protein n=1 Tax=Dictyostelium firmibasis TaxID=79012 RepID=A0AAN7U943_9MYCE